MKHIVWLAFAICACQPSSSSISSKSETCEEIDDGDDDPPDRCAETDCPIGTQCMESSASASCQPVEPGAPGASCGSSYDCWSGDCTDGHCTEVPPGGHCNGGTNQCADGNACTESTCEPPAGEPRGEGSACTANVECASDSCVMTPTGGACRGGTLVGGQSCARNEQCASSACIEGMCGGANPPGSACASNLDCGSLSCDGGVCQSQPPDHGACLAASDCGGSPCVDGQCAIVSCQQGCPAGTQCYGSLGICLQPSQPDHCDPTDPNACPAGRVCAYFVFNGQQLTGYACFADELPFVDGTRPICGNPEPVVFGQLPEICVTPPHAAIDLSTPLFHEVTTTETTETTTETTETTQTQTAN